MVVVRKASSVDAARIAEIHVDASKSAYVGLVPELELDALRAEQWCPKWEAWIGLPDVDLLVAQEEEIVGFCSIASPRDEDSPKGSGELTAIYVHPDYQSQGIGSALMEASLRCARLRNYSSLVLWVLPGNRRARTFYESRGFVWDGTERTNHGFETKLPHLRYKLSLRNDISIGPSPRRRREYAELVATNAGVTNERIVDAFARVPRENFLGRGPWCVSDSGEMSPTSDPAYVYQDIVIALDASKGITNGGPSLHARCIEALAPAPGDTIVHIGAGTGYFTALLADLVGPVGRITALEVDPGFAERARINLRHWANVTVEHASGTDYPLDALDGIYVSAGVSSLPPSWLDGLKTGGRLIFPLVPGDAEGAVLCVTRLPRGYPTKFIANARFYPCTGAQEDAPGLRAAFARGDVSRVRSLIRGEAADHTCWYRGSGWWLSTSSVEY